MTQEDFKMQFDIATIKHLGLQMYSTLPPVIGELVSNAWDADATYVKITIPSTPINELSEIGVEDNGSGMSDRDIREAYLVVGRDRRKDIGDIPTPLYRRRVMGRKGIGKFSAFGVAGEIEVESVKDGEVSRFQMNYSAFEHHAKEREIVLPAMNPTNSLTQGTKVTLRHFSKYQNRILPIKAIRRGLARRFSVIGEQNNFEIYVNGEPILPEERDLKRLLEKDSDGNPYLWSYVDEEILPGTGWTVSGWIGALNRTNQLEDGIQRGVVVMARGKLVQEPFLFDAVVGQQFALSYLVGELNAEFVDEAEDTIGTTRNTLVWDTEANMAFKQWGQKEINKITREWSAKRVRDSEVALNNNPLYIKFTDEAKQIDNKRAQKVADKLIKEVLTKNPVADDRSQEPMVQMFIDYLEFDAFWDLAQEMTETKLEDTEKLVHLFREWEVIEAKEMMRVTEGRITTIQKLQNLIDTNALEVPTLHNFLKDFPWVLDPRWTLIADEQTYSKLLKEKFPDEALPEEERRIDFLCVREGTDLIVVEIKRPSVRASIKELDQIRDYVSFMRDYVQRLTDPDLRHKEVTGYLLCGDLVDTGQVREVRKMLENNKIYVRRYSDLLRMVKLSHHEFLERYESLKAKASQ